MNRKALLFFCSTLLLGQSLLPWNPAASTPPTLSSWTPVDGYGTGVSADVTGGVLAQSAAACPSSYGCFHGLSVPAPSGAWTLTAHQNSNCATSGPEAGLFLTDTGTRALWYGLKGNLVSHVTSWYSPFLWNVDTEFPTAFGQVSDVWQQIQYDGTNFTLKLSATGSDFAYQPAQGILSASAWLQSAPAKVGFYVYTSQNGAACQSTLNYWKLTQP